MDSLLISTGVVALAEMGDKTQLLAFILAARFKKPVPIILGILAATIINHGLAGALGAWITAMANPEVIIGSVVLAGLSLSLGAGMLMLGAGVYFAAKGMAELTKQFKEMSPGQILATAGAFIGFAAV